MSFSGLYGDWIAIYSQPLPRLIFIIAVVHITLVLLLLYGVYGMKPRLWFIRKTQPEWANEETRLVGALLQQPTAQLWLALGWAYYRVGLYKKASEFLNKAKLLNAALPDALMLEGAIALQLQKFSAAAKIFAQLAASDIITTNLKAKSLLALADCYVGLRKLPEAENVYAQVIEIEPTLGDARYLFALLLSKMGRQRESEAQLLATADTYWIDPGLQARAESQRKGKLV
jgi:hypothetical protein